MKGLFYRQKAMLAAIATAPRMPNAPELQERLRRFAAVQEQPSYMFVPVPSEGWVSFQAENDLDVLEIRGVLERKRGKIKLLPAAPDAFAALTDLDRAALLKVDDAELRLDPPERSRVALPKAAGRSRQRDTIYTIGYEGRTLEAYLNRLLDARIEILCDVRSNPFSHKFGFQKGPLSKYCQRVGIGYEHIKELGVPQKLRKQMKEGESRVGIFSYYSREILKPANTGLQRVRELLDNGARIALTCFEAAACDCHRSHLAERLRTDLRAPLGIVDL